MSTLPLDILATSAGVVAPDPVTDNFNAMFDAASDFFAAIVTCAAKFSYASGVVGMSAIAAKFAGDPRLTAIQTLITVISSQCPTLSSSPLPPIYNDAQPPPTNSTLGGSV